MKYLLLALLFPLCSHLSAQSYQPTWESLESRPVPAWFKDGKFGIFIHWGVYAVPGWCTKGNYAEWYQYGLQTGDSSRINFHRQKFGNLSYYDLADQFKAELFNPEEWARVFEQSGAKYIVLTSKHHDGFCLWPDTIANHDWGFPWNAADRGPKRDLLGDLFKAVKKTSVHAGMYYSLYEWFNPLWKADKSKYAIQHAWPQMKELINNYKPDVFWTDGDWEASENVWKSKEFLAWLYNESPVKDQVVTYDRWGGDVRFKHGAVFTPEYQPDLDFEDHYWEESRGMGYSYGYNREEDAWDYNTAQSLVLQLVDKVSRGGNFLLDIGPDEHGKIPPIMQERLLQMGDWLNINGEAIYNTIRWKTPSQWTEGRKDYKPKNGGGDLVLKLTVDPDPGYAVKEAFFTYNSLKNNLYVLLPKYPSNHSITLKNISLPAGTKISFLSTGALLNWREQGTNLEISLPEYDPNKISAPYAYVLKIENFGKFTARPMINVDYKQNELKPVITMISNSGASIYYTIDGTEPNQHSILYKTAFVADHTLVINAIAISNGSPASLPSSATSAHAKVYEWMASIKPSGIKPGLVYRYFEPTGRIDMRSIKGQPTDSGIADHISIDKKKRVDKFAFEFAGYILIEKDDLYTFYTESDDGSMLFIDGVEIVNNDGDHGTQEISGMAALSKGYHKISVSYFDSGGGNALKISYQRGQEKKEELPKGILFH